MSMGISEVCCEHGDIRGCVNTGYVVSMGISEDV